MDVCYVDVTTVEVVKGTHNWSNLFFFFLV